MSTVSVWSVSFDVSVSLSLTNSSTPDMFSRDLTNKLSGPKFESILFDAGVGSFIVQILDVVLASRSPTQVPTPEPSFKSIRITAANRADAASSNIVLFGVAVSSAALLLVMLVVVAVRRTRVVDKPAKLHEDGDIELSNRESLAHCIPISALELEENPFAQGGS